LKVKFRSKTKVYATLVGFQRSPRGNQNTDSESDALVIANSESELERDEPRHQHRERQRDDGRKKGDSSGLAAVGAEQCETIESIRQEIARPLEAVTREVAGETLTGETTTSAARVMSSSLSDSETTVFPETVSRPNLEPSESIDLGKCLNIYRRSLGNFKK
jgi:hypothetical protein